MTATGVVDCPGPPWHMAAGALEYRLALRFERVERRIGIRQRSRPRLDRVGQRANAVVREEHALKGGEVVEELLGGSVWTCAWFVSAPSAWSWSVARRASS